MFVSYGVAFAQAAPKYVKDSPPDPVKVLIENGSGEVQIVFKWTEGNPPAGLKIISRVTDAVGTYNTIAAKDISFVLEEVSSVPAAPILIGRLSVNNVGNFNDSSAPYTGYVVFFSESAGAAPDTLKFELRRKPVANIASYFDNNVLNLAGTNFLPSLLNPLLPGVLYLILGVLFLIRDRFKVQKQVLLLIFSAIIIVAVGTYIGFWRNPGPKFSTVYVDNLQLTQLRSDQATFAPKEIGILTSDKGGAGKVYVEKRDGDYYLSFRGLPRAGEYNGKIPIDFISTALLSVKVKVADWVLYFFLTVLGGILAARRMTKSLESKELELPIVVAGSSVLAVLVTHFALYTDTWGSTLDYVKAFAGGAGVDLASKFTLVMGHRIAQWVAKK